MVTVRNIKKYEKIVLNNSGINYIFYCCNQSNCQTEWLTIISKLRKCQNNGKSWTWPNFEHVKYRANGINELDILLKRKFFNYMFQMRHKKLWIRIMHNSRSLLLTVHKILSIDQWRIICSMLPLSESVRSMKIVFVIQIDNLFYRLLDVPINWVVQIVAPSTITHRNYSRNIFLPFHTKHSVMLSLFCLYVCDATKFHSKLRNWWPISKTSRTDPKQKQTISIIYAIGCDTLFDVLCVVNLYGRLVIKLYSELYSDIDIEYQYSSCFVSVETF